MTDCVTQYIGFSLVEDPSDATATRMGLTHVILDEDAEVLLRVRGEDVEAVAELFPEFVNVHRRAIEIGKQIGAEAVRRQMRQVIGLDA